MSAAITAEWLAEIGFRWSQFERQPDKHWTLWLGAAMEDGPDIEDIGLEVAPGYDGKWFCWLRSDAAQRYGRFIHIRHLRRRTELVDLVVAIAGRPFDPADVFYGALQTPARAARFRQEADRLDRRLARAAPWSTDLADQPTLGRATAEHLAVHEKRRSEA